MSSMDNHNRNIRPSSSHGNGSMNGYDNGRIVSSSSVVGSGVPPLLSSMYTTRASSPLLHDSNDIFGAPSTTPTMRSSGSVFSPIITLGGDNGLSSAFSGGTLKVDTNWDNAPSVINNQLSSSSSRQPLASPSSLNTSVPSMSPSSYGNGRMNGNASGNSMNGSNGMILISPTGTSLGPPLSHAATKLVPTPLGPPALGSVSVSMSRINRSQTSTPSNGNTIIDNDNYSSFAIGILCSPCYVSRCCLC
jgi:hypothetical protein